MVKLGVLTDENGVFSSLSDAGSIEATRASRVIARTTPSFVAARNPIIPLASYRSGRKFPLPCSEIG
jgi:hypothetical protein